MNQGAITYAEAKAYANANPHIDSIQLRERFEKLKPDQCRKLVCRSRKKARKEGIEFEVNKPSRNRDEIYQAAKVYGFANPTITPFQLRQLFSINPNQSQKIMCLARKEAGVANVPQSERVLERLPNAKQAAILADSAKRKADAIEYARTHPHEYVTHIAKRFNVPTRAITAMRDAERQRRKREEAAKPKRRIRRLYAVLDDGSLVNPKTCKNLPPSPRFVEVMV